MLTSKNYQGESQPSLVTGSLWLAIWIMSWPLLLTTVSSCIVGMVDLKVAGLLGSTQQATVGVCEQILFLAIIFILSIGVGTTAITSRAYGAHNLTEAVRATSQSLIVAFIIGVILAVLATMLSQPLIRISTHSSNILTLGRSYLQIYAFYLIPFSIVSIINAAFRAIGDAKTPLLVVLSMTILNVVGDFVMVLGNWPIPGLGIKGIALASLVAGISGAVLALYLLRQSPLADSLLNLLRFDFTLIQRILKIGIPSACQRLSWALSVFVLFFVLSLCPNPTEALAAWTIGMRIEGLLFMPLMALSLAVSSIVGQSLGAQAIERAFKAGWHVTWIGVWLMICLSTLLFILAHPIAKAMSGDPKTIMYTVGYLQINAVAEPFLALGMILSGALQGAGDTRVPMWISIISNWIIRLPLAWSLALTFHLGPTGAWISMFVSITATSLMMVCYYQSRRWINIKV